MRYTEFKKQAWFEDTVLAPLGEGARGAQKAKQETNSYRNPLQSPHFKQNPVGPVVSHNVRNLDRSQQWKKDAPLLTHPTPVDTARRKSSMPVALRTYDMFGVWPHTNTQQAAGKVPGQAGARPQQQAAAQQRAQGAVFPVDQYRIQIGENPALTWDENAFNGSGDFNSIIQDAMPGLKEQLAATKESGFLGPLTSYNLKLKALQEAADSGDPAKIQPAMQAVLAAHPEFANQIANSIYNIQDQDRAAQLTDEALASGLAYFPQDQQQVIANAAKTRREWTPDTQAETPQTVVAQSGVTTNGSEGTIEPPPLINAQQRGVQAKDIFSKDKVKSYREFLAMDNDKKMEFAQSDEGIKLLTDLEQFFGDKNLDPDMRGDRLLAAINEGDQSVALLGNDILKLMDSAGDDTELSGIAAEVKKLFDGMSEDKQNEIKEAFQSKMWDAVAENPISNLPVAASMFLRSLGLGGMADFTETPWIFYLGSLALLFGVGSLFMGGGEQQQPNIVINNGGSQADPRMAQVPY